MIVVIDDNREFPFGERDDEIIYLRTEAEAKTWLVDYFIAYLTSGGYARKHIDELWMDHDLGHEGPPQQRRIVDTWGVCHLLFMLMGGAYNMSANPINVIYVHSQNSVRAGEIVDLLRVANHGQTEVLRMPLPEGTVAVL